MKNLSPWIVLYGLTYSRPLIAKRLLEKFGHPEEVLGASYKSLIEVEGISPQVAKIISERKYDREEICFRFCRIPDDTRIITFNDPSYPARLKEIPDPPLILYVKGHIPQNEAIAIVGTRRPTPYGRKVAEYFSEALARRGLTIVSGMARGIDGIAHKKALESGGTSVGVLGCGIDMVYPGEHRDLFKNIINKGAIISEFPPGTPPERYNFPRRNRIISGISWGTLVIEAAEGSGSLITARFALEQGREVFAVPGNINSKMSYGTNKLIKEGAKLVEDIQDIMEEHMPVLTHTRKHDIQNSPKVFLTEKEQLIYGLLSLEPLHIDIIRQKSGLLLQEVLNILMNLELKGLIEKVPGNRYIRASFLEG